MARINVNAANELDTTVGDRRYKVGARARRSETAAIGWEPRRQARRWATIAGMMARIARARWLITAFTAGASSPNVR